MLAAVALAGCDTKGTLDSPPPESQRTNIVLSSTAFTDGGAIPKRFTCDGEDVSPPLAWTEVPPGAKELVLLVEDPDADGGYFVHWTVFGIPPDRAGFDEGSVGEGDRIGENSFGNKRWNGPCPPEGDPPHRYNFLLYAVAEETGFSAGEPPDAIHRRVDDFGIIDSGKLTGTYAR